MVLSGSDSNVSQIYFIIKDNILRFQNYLSANIVDKNIKKIYIWNH